MTEPAQTTRHPSLVRRAMIVNAAMSLIAEQGLAATSAREIANAAGVSLGTVTYHFASVDDILVQVLWAQTERFEQRRTAKSPDAADPLDRILAFLAAYLDPNVHPQAMWRIWLDCWSRATHSPQLRSWQLARYHEVYERIEEMIVDGIAEDRFPPLDAKECAREFLALVDGLGEQMMIDPEMNSDRAMAILDGAVRRRLAAP